MKRLMNSFTLTLWVASVILLTVLFTELPTEVPSHYNINGEADAWANKAFVFIFPLLTLFLWIVLSQMEKNPRSFNMPGFNKENASVEQLKLMSTMGFFLKHEVSLLLIYFTLKVLVESLDILKLNFGIWEFIFILFIFSTTLLYYGIKVNRIGKIR